MNVRLRQPRAVLALSFLLLTVGTSLIVAGARGGSDSIVMAPNQPPVRPTVSIGGWSRPQDVTGNDPAADAGPALGVARNGAVTIAWERDGDGTFVEQTSNTSLNGAFGAIQELDSGITNGRGVHAGPSSGSLDAQGRRHILWWGYGSGGQVCGEYARVEPDGVARVNNLLTFTCLDSEPRKNIGLAVEADGSVHALFGRTGVNMYYSHMNASDVWDVQNERIVDYGSPKDMTVGVSSEGTVMAAWIANIGVNEWDVFVSTRLGPSSWSAPINLSSSLCGPTHGPALAGDSLGGMRIVWTQAACSGAGKDEIYYREWTPGGGWGSTTDYANPSQQNTGDSFQPSIAVDFTGMAHIVWSDDTGRERGNFQTYYAWGNLSAGFTSYGPIFADYFGSSTQKEPSIGVNPPGDGVPAYVHVSVRSDLTGDKEGYYSSAPLR